MAQIGRKPQDPALDQVTVSSSHKQIFSMTIFRILKDTVFRKPSLCWQIFRTI